nr:ribonuclease H-like domain-containing protein [Tanacetum cinerariifolium]
MANLKQASTLGTQSDKALVYDSDGSAEVHENCDDNEIFNMFTQEEQYTELLEPIPESHQVPQNDNNVVSEDNTHDTSANTKFAKKPIVENLPKVGETHALSKPVTSNSVSTPQESKGVNNDKVIAPGMFRINPFNTSKEEKHVPNNVSSSVRTKPVTISQPSIITKKEVNSNSNGLSSTGVDNTKTRRPQPSRNTKNDRRLHLLHMDLCGPMRIASINGKRYVLVIMDDYSRYTWVHFLRSKDEAPEVIIMFLKRITVLLQSSVIIIRIDNGTEFKNQVLKEYFDSVGISHQMSSIQTPQQNRVVERRNWTLVEAARI